MGIELSYNDILRCEPLLRSHLFTQRQIDVLKKRIQRQTLSVTEQTYFYKFIRPRLEAIRALYHIPDAYVRGRESILPHRLEEATAFLKILERRYRNKKILISGSFLFREDYKDIDVFVIGRTARTESHRDDFHVTFLPQGAEGTLFMESVSRISVSNVALAPLDKKVLEPVDVLQSYEMLVDTMLNKGKDLGLVRTFLLTTTYVSHGTVLDPSQLSRIVDRMQHASIALFTEMLVTALVMGFDKRLLKIVLTERISDYEKLLPEYKDAKNLPLYITAYKEALSIA